MPKTKAITIEILKTYAFSHDEPVIHIAETNLQFISQDVHLFGDGTFQFCPEFFYQLYSIYAYKNRQYLPCFFACYHR